MPSKQELLQQAAKKEALAATFDRYIQDLGLVFDRIPTTPARNHATWRGPAADRFTQTAANLNREMDELGESCQATARNLRRQAAQLRTQAAERPE
jgi:uncharacterized protein YukE